MGEARNVAVCCEDGKESSCSIKWKELLNQLKHYQLLKKDSAL
jgi:hypothetical protein